MHQALRLQSHVTLARTRQSDLIKSEYLEPGLLSELLITVSIYSYRVNELSLTVTQKAPHIAEVWYAPGTVIRLQSHLA